MYRRSGCLSATVVALVLGLLLTLLGQPASAVSYTWDTDRDGATFAIRSATGGSATAANHAPAKASDAVAGVPEPGTIVLLITAGLAAVAVTLRRRTRRS